MPPSPHASNTSKSRFWDRAGYYILGLAIGCLLVGLILLTKGKLRPPPTQPQTPDPATSPAAGSP
ncbi:MAG: hypothetical protein H7Y88_02935 [Phycisphaerales bacterium]|nr:hypothetical protein [Phycisphaerales bacterium]